MFHSIPQNRAYEMAIEFIREDGGRQTHGYVLPDLDPDGSHVRIYKLCLGFQSPHYRGYLDPYLKNLGPAVARADPDAVAYEVVTTDHRMQSLAEVRESERISRPIEKRYGPFPIE